MVPTAESIADFHRQDIAHAGHTREVSGFLRPLTSLTILACSFL